MTNVRPWVLGARRARERIAKIERGDRERELEKLAHPRNPQTLRREIAAIEFLETVKRDATFPADQLEGFPVAAIEYLMRWYKRDAKRAVDAAKKLLSGEYSTHALGKAEKDSREEIFAGTGKALEADYRRNIAEEIKNIACSKIGYDATPIEAADLESYSWDIKRTIDFAFIDKSKRGHIIAFVVVGPYRDPELYRRRSFEWVAKANALLNIFETVCLVIPDNGDVSLFVECCRHLRIDNRRLLIQKIQASRLPRPA